MNLNECIAKGYLAKIEPDDRLTAKELEESKYDIEHSASTLKQEDFKWSIVKSYYAMFHAARALLFRLGYREKRHFAVVVVLEELNKNGRLEPNFVDDFKAAISAREDADYHYAHSKETAEYNLNSRYSTGVAPVEFCVPRNASAFRAHKLPEFVVLKNPQFAAGGF